MYCEYYDNPDKKISIEEAEKLRETFCKACGMCKPIYHGDTSKIKISFIKKIKKDYS